MQVLKIMEDRPKQRHKGSKVHGLCIEDSDQSNVIALKDSLIHLTFMLLDTCFLPTTRE